MKDYLDAKTAIGITQGMKQSSHERETSASTRRDDLEWFRLWFGFLRISPSYELARRYRTGDVSRSAALPADFETVLAVYDDLGDLSSIRFAEWWRGVGFQHFGYEGQKPELVRLGVLSYDDDDDQLMRMRSSVRDYLTEEWRDQGQPTAIVAAIPVGVPKAQIMKQIAAMLGGIAREEREHERQLVGRSVKYGLVQAKLHQRSVGQYLDTMLAKARSPSSTLWQIGALANLSYTHSRWLDPTATPTGKDQTDARDRLKILTSRALHRGHMIAENAARGIFPSYVRCPDAVALDWAELGKRL